MGPSAALVDPQVEGPIDAGGTSTAFTEHGAGTLICERVVYSLPFGPLGALSHVAFVRSDL